VSTVFDAEPSGASRSRDKIVKNVAVLALNGPPAGNSDVAAGLKFRGYGDVYFLSSLWDSPSAPYRLGQSDREREYAKVGKGEVVLAVISARVKFRLARAQSWRFRDSASRSMARRREIILVTIRCLPSGVKPPTATLLGSASVSPKGAPLAKSKRNIWLLMF